MKKFLTNFDDKIDSFIKYCETKRLSKKTIQSYRAELIRLKNIITQEKDLGEYLLSFSTATHNFKITLYKQFSSVFHPELNNKLKLFSIPKIKNKDPKFLSEEEILKLKSYPMNDRERLYILLMLDLGLRLGELLSLKAQDFWNDSVSIIRKGGNQQRLPITQEILSIIYSLKLQPTELVCSMSRITMQRFVSHIAMQSLHRRISPHSLRHSFATQAIKSGVQIHVLQRFLGHSNVATTSRYLHVTTEDLQAAQNLMVRK